MNYTISLIINLKNNSNHSQLENIIYESGNNCNATNIFDDYELEGINKYIKTNNKIIILEFYNKSSFCTFLKFIKTIKQIGIEYIYESNNILYATKRYLNSTNNSLQNKTCLTQKIEKNKLKNDYKDIYTGLFN